MWQKEKKSKELMILILIIYFLTISIQLVEGTIIETIIESPFNLRARTLDSQTASVRFQIAGGHKQRQCQRYKFTVRRNREQPYSMPEQNLTFWINSLELKHLPVGDYRICAIICSEYLNQHQEFNNKTNHTKPISVCVTIHALRSHYLILTLYILVFCFLAFSHIIFTLRKRTTQARIKMALFEVEHTLQKWRTTHTPSGSVDHTEPLNILQNLITLPASPIEHSLSSSCYPIVDDEQQQQQPEHEQHRPSYPIMFHLETPNEHHETLEIP